MKRYLVFLIALCFNTVTSCSFQKNASAIEPIWDIPASDITRIRVTDYRTLEYVELRKLEDDSWYQVFPDEGPIDSSALEPIMVWLENPIPKKVLTVNPLSEDMKPYGFTQPRGSLQISFQGQRAVFFYVGKSNLLGTSTYMSRPIGPIGTEIFVIERDIIKRLFNLIGSDLIITPTPIDGYNSPVPPAKTEGFSPIAVLGARVSDLHRT